MTDFMTASEYQNFVSRKELKYTPKHSKKGKFKESFLKPKETEYALCKNLTKYLNTKYPGILFHWDTGSGTKLTMGQAVKMKALNSMRGYPDLFIAEARGKYYGLFIEVKKDGEKLYKLDGTFKNEHLEEQDRYLKGLIQNGYCAVFGIGFEKCKTIIDNYLRQESV